jgi:alcohol dehydrogenase class IV
MKPEESDSKYSFLTCSFEIRAILPERRDCMFSVWESKNPIMFGVGSSAFTGEKAREMGCRKVLCIFGDTVKKTGVADGVLAGLRAAGIEIVPFNDVFPDPPDHTVEAAAQLGRDRNVDGIVAIGGGSAMDIAKACRVLLTFPSPIGQYYCGYDTPPLDESNMKPLILLPTTAGTGSETSPGAVITDSATNVKNIVNVSVSLGIVDPALTVAAPPALTANTGVDALAHVIESLTSNLPNPFCDILGKEAISLIRRNLPKAYRNGSDLAAREAMSLSATIATVCVRGGFIHIPHGFGENIVSVWDIPHGVAVAAFLPEAMRFVAPAIPDRVRAVAESLGARVPAVASPEEIGDITTAALIALFEEIDIPPLRRFVDKKEDLIAHTDAIIGTGELLRYSPRPMGPQEIEEFLIRAYESRR